MGCKENAQQACSSKDWSADSGNSDVQVLIAFVLRFAMRCWIQNKKFIISDEGEQMK